jgi:general secretion pathway protein F
VRKKVVSSAIYPVLLIVVGTLVTIFLLGYVVPKFSVMLETTGNRASSASRLLLELGGLIGRHQTLVWGGLAALLALLAGVFGQKGMRARAVAWLAELPVIRKFSLTLSLARFYRTVALLLDAGIPLLKALEMSSSLLTPRGAAVLPGVREKVRTGLLLSAAMENTALLTPIAESLIKVGEKSGKLAEMMERIARFLDEELARQVDWFTRLFEPLLMTAIGLVIGMVVVLMYMPIFDLVESFQ